VKHEAKQDLFRINGHSTLCVPLNYGDREKRKVPSINTLWQNSTQLTAADALSGLHGWQISKRWCGCFYYTQSGKYFRGGYGLNHGAVWPEGEGQDGVRARPPSRLFPSRSKGYPPSTLIVMP
jgi:hypothetical protein